MQLGLGALATALLLGFYAIPTWVSAPANIKNIILSPTFWPYVLTALLGMVSFALVITAWRSKESNITTVESEPKAWFRLLALAVIMLLTMFALPRLGMVLTTVILFAATAFLFKTRHPVIALVCALVFPFVLYLFFAHVAGVAIPQGNYIRLP